MTNTKKSVLRTLAFTAAAAIALTVGAGALLTASAETTDNTTITDVQSEYYKSEYTHLADNLEENSGDSVVFQSVTWEELVVLLESEGNYLILFGGSWCPNTTAVIGYINEVANDYGVSTIYNFDFRLDGANRSSHVRETNGASYDGATYNYLYGELVTRYITNLNDFVEYTVDSSSALTYTNSNNEDVTVPKVQVPFLALYNKDNEISGESAPIVAGYEKMLYWDETGENGEHLYSGYGENKSYTSACDYKDALITNVFSKIPQSGLTSFTDGDYIRTIYNQKSGETIFESTEQINFVTLTYHQLEWLLQQNGAYLIFFAGSWCGNTQAIVDIVNDYAVTNNLTVYTFDTKLDSGYAKKYWGYSKDLHIRDSSNEFASLYVDLVNTYLTNIETEYDVATTYISYTNSEDTEVKANKLQVPYFFAYNKNNVDKNAHDAPILSYVELMYVRSTSSDSSISNTDNYTKYTTQTQEVITAYKSSLAGDLEITLTSRLTETTAATATTDSSATASDADSSGEGLSTGAIVGIVIGGVVLVGVIVGLAVFFNKRKQSKA
ncbi:MAG: hypothetical protein LUF82_04885 [Clostridia bacterium]|nr:hypothetical protein [Clostridia bacterium]